MGGLPTSSTLFAPPTATAAAAVTSAVRWERDGYLRRSARNLTCLSLWFAGVPPRVIGRLYG